MSGRGLLRSQYANASENLNTCDKRQRINHYMNVGKCLVVHEVMKHFRMVIRAVVGLMCLRDCMVDVEWLIGQQQYIWKLVKHTHVWLRLKSVNIRFLCCVCSCRFACMSYIGVVLYVLFNDLYDFYMIAISFL